MSNDKIETIMAMIRAQTHLVRLFTKGDIHKDDVVGQHASLRAANIMDSDEERVSGLKSKSNFTAPSRNECRFVASSGQKHAPPCAQRHGSTTCQWQAWDRQALARRPRWMIV
eukprot:1343736-Amphidinium_carterae.3